MTDGARKMLIVVGMTVWGWIVGYGTGRMTTSPSFTCPAGQEPELVWAGDVVTVTGKCEVPAIRFVPKGE
jgi:hypothetical protein